MIPTEAPSIVETTETNREGCATRPKAKPELRSDLHEWYHPHGSAVNCGNHACKAEKSAPPAAEREP